MPTCTQVASGPKPVELTVDAPATITPVRDPDVGSRPVPARTDFLAGPAPAMSSSVFRACAKKRLSARGGDVAFVVALRNAA